MPVIRVERQNSITELNIFPKMIEYLQNYLKQIFVKTGRELFLIFRLPTKNFITIYGAVHEAKTLFVEYDDNPQKTPQDVTNLVGKPTAISDKSSIFDGSYHPANKTNYYISIFPTDNNYTDIWKTLPFLTHREDILRYSISGNMKPIYLQKRGFYDSQHIYKFLHATGQGYRYLFYPYYKNRLLDARYIEFENNIKQMWIQHKCYEYPKDVGCISKALTQQYQTYKLLNLEVDSDRQMIDDFEKSPFSDQIGFNYQENSPPNFYKSFIMLDEFDVPPQGAPQHFYIGKLQEITIGRTKEGGTLKAVTNDLDIVSIAGFYQNERRCMVDFAESYPQGRHGEYGFITPVFDDNFFGQFITDLQENFDFSLFMHGPECAFYRSKKDGAFPNNLYNIAGDSLVLIGYRDIFKTDIFFDLLEEIYKMKIQRPGDLFCNLILNASWLTNVDNYNALLDQGFIDGYDKEKKILDEIFKLYIAEQTVQRTVHLQTVPSNMRLQAYARRRKATLMEQLSPVTRREFERQTRDKRLLKFIFDYRRIEEEAQDIPALQKFAHRKRESLIENLSPITRGEFERNEIIDSARKYNYTIPPFPYFYHPQKKIFLTVYLGGLSGKTERVKSDAIKLLNFLDLAPPKNLQPQQPTFPPPSPHPSPPPSPSHSPHPSPSHSPHPSPPPSPHPPPHHSPHQPPHQQPGSLAVSPHAQNYLRQGRRNSSALVRWKSRKEIRQSAVQPGDHIDEEGSPSGNHQ